MRVIVRVHDGTTDCRTNAQPAGTSSLTQVNQAVIFVADRTDGSAAVAQNLADFARGQTQNRVAAFGTQDLCGNTSGTCQLAALARLQFNVVNESTFRDVAQLHRVADLDVDRFAGNDGLSDLHSLRSQDIALFTVCIIQQRDVGGTVRIVLDRRDLRRDVVFITLEVDHAVLTLVSAALMTGCDPTGVVAAALFGQRFKQRAFWRSRCDFFEAQA